MTPVRHRPPPPLRAPSTMPTIVTPSTGRPKGPDGFFGVDPAPSPTIHQGSRYHVPDMPPITSRSLPHRRCEVAIVGGGIGGGALALLLRRRLGGARIVLVEERQVFPPAGGEVVAATAGLFFTRDLPLGALLAREHLPAHGARYWFADSRVTPLEELSELGAWSVPELPAFHVDRSRLAEALLALGARAGVAVCRPARVVEIDPHWPWSRLTVETDDGLRRLEARWVVDAGGDAALLARRLGLHEALPGPPREHHEARWSGAADLDELAHLRRGDHASRLPAWPASRTLAANHFCGRGWCARLTPLPGEQTAVALAGEAGCLAPSQETSALQAYSRFVRSRPGVRELLRGASIDPESFASRELVPWYPRDCCGLGWFLVGDAAGSVDPLFGTPLERAAATVLAAARIIGDDLSGAVTGQLLEERLAAHAPSGRRSCVQRHACCGEGHWLELLGDARLTAAAVFLDAAFASLELRRHLGVAALRPDSAGGAPFGWTTLRACLRERLVHLARRRLEQGLYGRSNRGWRRGARTGAAPLAAGALLAGLSAWLRLEAEDFRQRFTPIEHDSRVPSPEEITAQLARLAPTDQALRRSRA